MLLNEMRIFVLFFLDVGWGVFGEGDFCFFRGGSKGFIFLLSRFSRIDKKIFKW